MRDARQRGHKSRITLARVAEHAGVSVTTVSLILANRNGWIEQFHPATVQRVRASAETLGYRRNLFAGGLPSGEQPFFALVLREAETAIDSWHYWAFQGALLEGVNAAAERQSLFAVMSTMQGSATADGAMKVEAIMEGGVFGTILRTPGAKVEELVRTRQAQRYPVVAVFPERVGEWPTNAIDLDNTLAGRTAGKLLAAARRRHWLLVHYERMTEAHRLRYEGFRQLAREVGVKQTEISLPLKVDEDGAARLLGPRFEQETPDAVYALDSVSSIGAVLGCLRARLTPGSDCAIVGCDASQWRIPGLPRITSVDVSWRHVGVLAVEHLLRARDNRGRFRTVLLKPRVVEADTCPVPAKFQPERLSGSSMAHDLSGVAG